MMTKFENKILNSFNKLIDRLSDSEGRQALKGMQRGIEREALRIDDSGNLATDAHPKMLGSALTHSRITTDYSESLLEFITPVFTDIDRLLEDLTYTHAFTVQNLPQQGLWPVSMPCYVGDVSDIPIADYGSSNTGKMKRLYRKGLTYRYGAQMQIISGVHFNFSVSDSLLDRLYQLSDQAVSKTDFISESYLGLIRNYRRMVWVLPYLFGASPALCRSFIKDQQTDIQFEEMGKGTLYLPYATSLRMSDLGYTNKEQDRLSISYNSLELYLEGMQKAINMPSANFELIGVKVDGEFRQLNANVLQIENEFYSPIRAKRVAQDGEKPSEALARAGVEYIEVRALDVNPFSEVGIEASQVRFLDLFLLYCLLSDSPDSDETQETEITSNLNLVILEGRKPGLKLSCNGEEITLADWMTQMFNTMGTIATLLDDKDNHGYAQTLEKWLAAVENPDLTLSGQIIKQLQDSQIDHGCWVKALAKKYHRVLNETELPEDVLLRYQVAAKESLAKQLQMEQDSTQSFESFLEDYFKEDTSSIEASKLAVSS
ncbi:glutamate--cysteine ligase [Shewanella eurypsychrophilus]|uniref:Glutamate--cysteine ligase n=1 Tax=Shewanella eurypsychrophilus TaxID=2593656 RepID=A0ABX6VBX2_9GAMM|nr:MULTISPECIES: glutamate--cysteine ligase [Shewanella]QFU23822.1 glutamate--cysteine ligase [Shewanella sp. YLB-09]QPG59044.1 glutamate--cysteine ligase [Shewanella eurypsychrophilus]